MLAKLNPLSSLHVFKKPLIVWKHQIDFVKKLFYSKSVLCCSVIEVRNESCSGVVHIAIYAAIVEHVLHHVNDDLVGAAVVHAAVPRLDAVGPQDVNRPPRDFHGVVHARHVCRQNDLPLRNVQYLIVS